MKTVQTKIPVMFQTIQEYDDRFLRVKIWLMHLGENYNGSIFEKQYVQDAISSLANTPILGYIENGLDGEDDFTDHRTIAVKENGRYNLKYIGQAFGVIPQDNNAKFEKRVGDDGVEREYLTCEGLLWQKWDDPIDIMNSDVVKSQSMELHEKYDGYYDDNNFFHFTKFKFFGACILGDDIPPAMEGATVEVENMFSLSDAYKDIQLKMEEFKTMYSKYQSSEQDNDIEIKEEGEKMPEAKDNTVFSLSAEQMEAELSDVFEDALKVGEGGFTYQEYWYVDHLPDQGIVIAYDCDDEYLVGFDYTVNGDVVTVNLESERRIKVDYVPMNAPAEEDEDEITPNGAIDPSVEPKEFKLVHKSFSESKSAKAVSEKENAFNELNAQFTSVSEELNSVKGEVEELNTKFEAIESEAKSLREFKSSKQAEERQAEEDAVFTKFSEQLSDEEISSVKEVAHTLSIAQIEKELFSIVGMKFASKITKEVNQSKGNVKIGFERMDNKEPIVSYDYLLEKHVKR